MPDVAGIAREAMASPFDAFGGVVEAITGDAGKARKIARHATPPWPIWNARLARAAGSGGAFGKKFEADVSTAAEELACALTRGVMSAVFVGRTYAMEKRTDALEKNWIGAWKRGEALEARADALCVQVAARTRCSSSWTTGYLAASVWSCSNIARSRRSLPSPAPP